MIVCDAFGGKWTKSQARRGRSSSSTMSRASPLSTRKSSWSASQWYIDIGSPGPRTKRLTPTCSNSGSPSNVMTLPRGPRSYQTASCALRTNQPSPFGTSPCSVCSSPASGTIGPYTDRDGDVIAGRGAPASSGMDESARAERGLEVLRRQEADPRAVAAHDLRGGALPEHRRVLGARHRDVPDPRRHVHTRLSLLLRQLRQARASAGSARALPAREGGSGDGAEARRGHVRRPRRRARPRCRSLRRD